MARAEEAEEILCSHRFDIQRIKLGRDDVIVANRRFFRWRWFATALHVNVFRWKAEGLDAPDGQAPLRAVQALRPRRFTRMVGKKRTVKKRKGGKGAKKVKKRR